MRVPCGKGKRIRGIVRIDGEAQKSVCRWEVVKQAHGKIVEQE